MAASQQQTVLPKSGQTEQHIPTIEPSSLLEGSLDISITDPWEPQSIQNAWPPSAFDADPTVPKKQQQGNLPPNKQLCPCHTMQLPPHRMQETPTCDAGEADGGIRLTSFNTKTTSLHDLEAGQLYSNQ